MGLLSNNVFSILVDDDVMWFGTDLGVSRFDGRWQSFPTALVSRQLPQRNPLPTTGRITALAATTGGVWIGTEHGFVARLDGNRWSQVSNIGSPVHDLMEIDGALWLATDNGLLLLRDGALSPIAALAGIPSYDLFVESTTVWLGAGDGLWRLSLAATDVEHLDLAKAGDLINGPIHALWGDGLGTLWLGLGRQVVQFNTGNQSAPHYEPFSTDGEEIIITAVIGVAGDSVWFATNGAGVIQYPFVDGEPASTTSLGSSTEGGLNTNNVRALAIDGDGSVWFASPVGVYRYQPWAWLDVDSRLNGVAVNDLLYDKSGNLWVATDGEGVQRRHGTHAFPETFSGGETIFPSETINDLEEDPRGRLWVATPNGIAQYNNGDWSTPIPIDQLPSPNLRHLQADANGIWIGTSAGLAHYAFATHLVSIDATFSGRAIDNLELDNLGRLWVATHNGGLWLRDRQGAWTDASSVGKGMPLGALVTAFLADPEVPGGMYAGFADAGVFRWDGSRWINVDRQQWAGGDRVLSLLREPADGTLWIGSEIGLSRLDRLSMTTYDLHDGMQNGAIRAIQRAPNGDYWFGGPRGLALYRPEQTPPWIMPIGQSSAGTQTPPMARQIYAGRSVEINFAVGDVQTEKEKLRVFYRLNTPRSVGDWRETTLGTLILPMNEVGEFVVELVVRDQAFNYSQPITQALIAVAPPILVELPVLGAVDARVFQLLILFGSLGLFGFGYVSYEILQHRLRISAAIRRRFNPYISGEPVRREDMFFGRQDLLRRIVATLHNNSIMIFGERRIGKTTILYQLSTILRQINDSEYWFVPVFIDLEGTTEDRLFHLLMEEIAQTVTTLPNLTPFDYATLDDLLFYDAPATHYSDREFGRDLRTTIRLLEQYCTHNHGDQQVRVILLIDEVDTLSKFDHLYQQQMRRIFMRDFASTVGAVVAGIEISKEWDRVESPWYNLFNEIAMVPFTRAQAAELLIEPVRGYYLYEPAALQFIINHSEGRPYRIQQYALEAVNHMLKEKRRRITLEDVLVAQALTSLEGADPLNPNTKPVLSNIPFAAPPAIGQPI